MRMKLKTKAAKARQKRIAFLGGDDGWGMFRERDGGGGE